MRSRKRATPLMGFLWLNPERPEIDLPNEPPDVRHLCQLENGMEGYGFYRHDGRMFAQQNLTDASNRIIVSSEFLKKTGDTWGLRISGRPLDEDSGKEMKTTLVFYMASQHYQDWFELKKAEKSPRGLSGPVTVEGYSPLINNFTLYFPIGEEQSASMKHQLPRLLRRFKAAPDLSKVQFLGMTAPENQAWRVGRMTGLALQSGVTKAKQLLASSGARSHRTRHAEDDEEQGGGEGGIPLLLPNSIEPKSNVVMLQWIFNGPFTLDMAFVGSSKRVRYQDLVGQPLTESLTRLEDLFDKRFEDVFRLSTKMVGTAEVACAKYALSNLIGGIGYFSGTWISAETGKMPASELFTAVPSRSTFPRGFLWDEGFHNQLIYHWDHKLALDILSHWMMLMDSEGYIAREQILGDEARSRVPEQFHAQHRSHANPPSWFLVVDSLLDTYAGVPSKPLYRHIYRSTHATFDAYDAPHDMAAFAEDEEPAPYEGPRRDDDEVKVILKGLYPKLKLHYQWLRKTQAGEDVDTFMWRGRTPDGQHTLSSGLDDYPRASYPLPSERHLDLYCWMAYVADVLERLAAYVDNKDQLRDDRDHFANIASTLTDRLYELHWDSSAGLYADFAAPPERISELHAEHTSKLRRLDPTSLRDAATLASLIAPPESSFVQAAGYVSLFPLLMGMIPPDSPTLNATLHLIYDPNRLWSPYGLRSMSKSSKFFGTGENYWRGPIWININYMVLRALRRHYLPVPGPYAKFAGTIYTSLRNNLINNIAKEHARTGFIWEQYHPLTGRGQKTHPFTGWSSLVTLIMAEYY